MTDVLAANFVSHYYGTYLEDPELLAVAFTDEAVVTRNGTSYKSISDIRRALTETTGQFGVRVVIDRIESSRHDDVVRVAVHGRVFHDLALEPTSRQCDGFHQNFDLVPMDADRKTFGISKDTLKYEKSQHGLGYIGSWADETPPLHAAKATVPVPAMEPLGEAVEEPAAPEPAPVEPEPVVAKAVTPRSSIEASSAVQPASEEPTAASETQSTHSSSTPVAADASAAPSTTAPAAAPAGDKHAAQRQSPPPESKPAGDSAPLSFAERVRLSSLKKAPASSPPPQIVGPPKATEKPVHVDATPAEAVPAAEGADGAKSAEARAPKPRTASATDAPAEEQKRTRQPAFYQAFVKGLPEGTTEEELLAAFLPYGKNIIKKPMKIDSKIDQATGIVRTFAFLNFNTEDPVAFVQSLQKKVINVNGKKVDIDVAKDKFAKTDGTAPLPNHHGKK